MGPRIACLSLVFSASCVDSADLPDSTGHPGPTLDEFTISVVPDDPTTRDDVVASLEVGIKSVEALEWSWTRERDGRTLSGPTLGHGLTAAGDIWTVAASNGDSRGSATLTIRNSPPRVTSVATHPPVAHAGVVEVSCHGEAEDDDQDGTTLEYTWTHGSGDEHSGAILPKTAVAGSWRCRARAFDGLGWSASVWADAMLLEPLPEVWRYVPSGTGVVGSPADETPRLGDDHPRRTVVISRSFYMMAAEATEGLWQSLLDGEVGPRGWKLSEGDLPMVRITRHDAQALANALSERDGLPPCYACEILQGLWDVRACRLLYLDEPASCPGYRLPTDSEWEYAARSAGTVVSALPWGAEWAGDIFPNPEVCGDPVSSDGVVLDDYVVGCFNGSGVADSLVRTPNALGIRDLVGNVWEWVEDGHGLMGDEADPFVPSEEEQGVVAGGDYDDSPFYLRMAARLQTRAGSSGSNVGVRLVRTAPEHFLE